MSNYVTYPRQDAFDSSLSSDIDSSTLSVVLNDSPSFTLSGSNRCYGVIDYDNNLLEIVKIQSISGATLTLESRGVAKYEGGASTAVAHSAGAKFAISHDWVNFSDIATAIATKADIAGQVFTGPVTFSGATNNGLVVNSLTTVQRDALSAPANGQIIYNTTEGEFQIYQGGAWSTMASGSTQPDATTTVAGKSEVSTEAQALAGTVIGETGASMFVTSDVLAKISQDSSWKYATTGGSSSAYTLSVTPAPTAYATGQVFYILANHTNTTAPTININSLGVKNIYKNSTETLVSGDIVSGAGHVIMYDGTQFQLISHIPRDDDKFGGTGSDGALSITSGTTTIDLAGATYVAKNYSSISITGTGALAFSNPASTGSIIHLKCLGNASITSSATRAIDLRSLGASGGAGGTGTGAHGNGANGTQSADLVGNSSTFGLRGGDTGDRVNGAGGARYDGSGLYTTNSRHVNSRHSILVAPGSGGGGGERGANGNAGTGDGGAGGRGGGALIMDVAGSYSCSATIDASGTAGTAGQAGANVASGGGGGGGGGGTGGQILIQYNILTSDTGTYTVSAGAGGAGGAAGAGSSGSTGGAGGGGAGGITSAGTTSSDNGNNVGNAGGAGVAGSAVIMENVTFS